MSCNEYSNPYSKNFPSKKSIKETTSTTKSSCLGSMSIDLINTQMLDDILSNGSKEVEGSDEKVFEQTRKIDLNEIGICLDDMKPQPVKRIKIKSIIPACNLNHKPSLKSIKQLSGVSYNEAFKL